MFKKKTKIEPFDMPRLGHPALRVKSEPVPASLIREKKFQLFLDRLISTMRQNEGVGIAAPQVGVANAIFCVECRSSRRYSDVPNIPLYVAINPHVTILDASEVGLYEGCLSVPDLRGHVLRAKKVKLEALDRDAKPFEITAQGFHARIIQHEWDHLLGNLYVDRVKDTRTLSYVEFLK
jgi:peptide deformylase